MLKHNKFGYFILFLGISMFSTTGISQGFFPELSTIPSKKEVEQRKNQQVTDSETDDFSEEPFDEEDDDEVSSDEQDEDEVEEDDSENIPYIDLKRREENTADEEDDEPQNKRSLRMYPDNIQINLMPVQEASTCILQLKFTNQSKKVLNSFNAEVSYDSYKTTFRASNLAPGATIKQNLVMYGPVCLSLSDPPLVNISDCQLGTLSLDRCKEKFFFDPPNIEY